ncbi:Choline transporter-like protein 4 [Lamellibrachia satsuma]|nr:Choline transporter-like protein 4 [Lamellibrachia satsuma]
MGKQSNKVDPGESTKYDPTFNGPIKNRSCTDIICCLLFIICFVGMIAVGVYGFSRGDPNRLLYPTDSNGNLCGQGDYKAKPNLLFFDLVSCLKMGAAVVISGCPTTQVCVETCPNSTWMWYSQYAAEQISSNKKRDRDQMICKYTVNAVTSTKTVKQLVEDEDCAPYYVDSNSSKSSVGSAV